MKKLRETHGELADKIQHVLEHEVDNTTGVNRLLSWQWFLVATCFYAGFCLMAFDPWFGRDHFHYGFSMISLLIAYVILVTLFFDVKLFGRNQGPNLFLQISFIFPLLTFVARILGRPGPDVEQRWSLMGQVRDILRGGGMLLFGGEFPPRIVQEILMTPGTALLMALLFAGTVLPKSRGIKVGFMLLVLIGALFSTIASEQPPSMIWFVGFALMLGGLYFMYHDVESLNDDRVLVSTLKGVEDAAEYATSLKLCSTAIKHGELSLNTALDIVEETYQTGDAQKRGYIAETICTRLIERFKLLELVHAENKMLIPGKAFTRQPGLFEIAVLLPRDIVIVVVAILWIISPLDLIPDAIPFIGILDDMFIAYIGGCSLRNAFRSVTPNHRHPRG